MGGAERGGTSIAGVAANIASIVLRRSCMSSADAAPLAAGGSVAGRGGSGPGGRCGRSPAPAAADARAAEAAAAAEGLDTTAVAAVVAAGGLGPGGLDGLGPAGLEGWAHRWLGFETGGLDGASIRQPSGLGRGGLAGLEPAKGAVAAWGGVSSCGSVGVG